MLDAKALGQLLLMQSILSNLPDKRSIFSFVCRGLTDIPGVEKVSFSESDTILGEPSDCEIQIPIKLDCHLFGLLCLGLSDKELYTPYRDYINNFVFMIEVILDERNQRELNQKHQDELERRIQERTQELTIEIDERKIAEEKLLVQEERLRLSLEAATDAIWDWDLISNDTYFSPRWFEILGYKPYEVKMNAREWVALAHPDDKDSALKTISQAITDDLNYEVEFRSKHADGHWVWCLVKGKVTERDPNGKPLRLSGTNSDITIRKGFEQQILESQLDLRIKNQEYQSLNEEYVAINEEYVSINEELSESNEILQKTIYELESAKRKAEESDRLKTAFLQNISHEIRTPLNAIMGFADLLTDNFDNKEKQKSFTTIIKQRGDDLLMLINDILDIARIESGQLTLNFEELDVKSFFDELEPYFNEYRSRLQKNHIQFSIQISNDILGLVLFADRSKLKQIFVNLIGNAFKFTNSGRVEVGCSFNGENRLSFYVSDTGIGIPEKYHQSIFERFFQVETELSRNYGGTGLGLSIVKGMIALMNGNLEIESKPGLGSRFTFDIPVGVSQKQIKRTNGARETIIDLRTSKTILIVEDDFFNTEYLKEALSNCNFILLFTDLGRNAIDICVKDHIDIVLLDIRLPDMMGYEVSQIIKQQKPQITIIAQTAYASPNDKQKALDSFCDDYISKPINRNVLISKLNQYLIN